ncbi:EF-hand calcium-binding domain-containing protein 5-like [Tubulanus polymorphus]|uniref:EF-hand calcium-binding domain-containing protein 5-like n=1 Tax=Tubulanus polymorphus TaxID=672921 RepID=UPI003DA2D0A1
MADVQVASSGSRSLYGSRPNSRPSRPSSRKTASRPGTGVTGSRPGTGRHLTMISSPAVSLGSRPVSRYTNVPDHLNPLLLKAVKRWKHFHEQKMMEKLKELRIGKKHYTKSIKDKARRIARKIPVEILAKQWLNKDSSTVETRAYLVDKLLPVLVLGTEKLLMEVDKRGLADISEPDPNFNPINFLAQFLMRNNPRYSNFCEASPYMRSMREVAEELKSDLFDYEGNRLAKLKADARKKREEREIQLKMKELEKKRKQEALRQQFLEWKVGPDGSVELCLIQSALKSFEEILAKLPEELREAAKFVNELDEIDDSGRLMSMDQFCLYLSKYTDEMASDIFDQFIDHLNKCAQAYISASEREHRRLILNEVFKACDNGSTGVLDRHRILILFEHFYDTAQKMVQESLRNPRRWPVIQLDEEESDASDDEDVDRPKKKRKQIEVETKEIPQTETIESKADEKKPETGEKADVEKASEESDTVQEEVTATDDNSTQVEETEAVVEESEVKEEEQENQQEEESVKENVEENKDESTEGKDDVAQEEIVDEEKTIEVVPEDNIPVEKEKSVEFADQKEDIDDKVEKADDDGAKLEEQTEEAGEEKIVADENATEKEKTNEDVDEKEADESLLRDKTEAELQVAGVDVAPQSALPGRQSAVTFAEGTSFQLQRDRTNMSQMSRSQSQASAFDENTLNTSQFVQITETFLGDSPLHAAFNLLIKLIEDGYAETEEERMRRLKKAQRELKLSRRKGLADGLFEKWDNDAAGFLELEEVEELMNKYKGGIESQAVKKGKKKLKKEFRIHDNHLNKKEFRAFLEYASEEMAGGDDAFEFLVEFLTSSIERSYIERIRGQARKKWLHQIVASAQTSGASLEPVYRQVFQALYKDAETHGDNKKICANISMLERNDAAPERGRMLLRYVAATPEDAPYVLGQYLFKDMKGVSFAAVEGGKPIHVPRVNNHGNIMFWNTERPEEDREGSLIVIPLKDKRKRVFGLLNVDTVNDPRTKAIFITHEIQFFQGVAKSFGQAFKHVDIRKKMLRIVESALTWIKHRSPSVNEVMFYMVEPDGKSTDYVLRRMTVSDEKGNTIQFANPERLERKDNLFRDYLFKTVDNSESVSAHAYGQRHLTFPLRDDLGKAVGVVDISIGDMKKLPAVENKEVMKMLRLLQMAHMEVLREAAGQEGTILESDYYGDEDSVEVLFDRLMLLDLRENVSNLDAKAYAELRSYHDPPKIIHSVIKAVLTIFYPEKATEGIFDDWGNCKQFVNIDLSHMVMSYDPTEEKRLVAAELVAKPLSDVPHGDVAKHGSIPAQHLYNWVFVCLSLIEHSHKMRENKKQSNLPEIPNSADEPCEIADVPPGAQKEITSLTTSTIAL